MRAVMNFWLMKSEPDVFSIDDLKREKTTGWDSVRNYQARNFMRDEMQLGDLVLFYHSNAEPSGVAGVAKIVGPAVPDPLQFDAIPTLRVCDGSGAGKRDRVWGLGDYDERSGERISAVAAGTCAGRRRLRAQGAGGHC